MGKTLRGSNGFIPQPLQIRRVERQTFYHCWLYPRFVSGYGIHRGVPKEIVFAQDRLLTISENFGDVIYTAEFERFRQNMGFRVYLCRKDDPESKSKIEAVIK